MNRDPLPGEASSRTLTFLMTDLVGSTNLWERFPEGMQPALARHDTILREAVESSNGQVVKTTGDGLMAVFASALDGVNACIQAQLALQAEPWDVTGPMRVRMGLHVGEAQPRSGDYYGPAVNRAARLMAAAHGGQVLLSAVTAQLVLDLLPDELKLRDLGEHHLKDLSRPEHVFQLLHPRLEADFPAIVSLENRPNNLPAQPTPLIGREKELGEILEKLKSDEVRLLTLTGPGGIGKTRLGLQTAAELIDHFENGVYFVDLAPIREREAVLPAIAQTVGIRDTGDQSVLEELKGQLGTKRMLLLLDNFEQITATAPDVVELLRNCPNLKFLVTSREALHVRFEYIYPVPPLALPNIEHKPLEIDQLTQYEAVRLFIERAQAAKPDFMVTNENAPAVAEICIRLDGLPLAIELAAARIGLFSPEALLERLGARLKILRGGARDLPVRQQTMRDAIDWSYELLDSGEQRLFEMMAVFNGGSTLEAAEEVANGIERLDRAGVDVLDGISSLVEKSLLRQAQPGLGEPRLLMLETIREYGAERLQADPEFQAAARRRHAEYYADLLHQQYDRIKRHRRAEVVAWLEVIVADIENLRAAWSFWIEERDLEHLWKLIDILWILYDTRGWYHAAIGLATDMLTVLASAPPSKERIVQEINLQTALARALLTVKGYTGEVEQAYMRAVDLSKSVGEIPQLFPVLRGLGSLYGYIGKFEKAAEMAERIVSLAESLHDEGMLVEGKMTVGYSQAFLGNVSRGLRSLDEAVASYNPDLEHIRDFAIGNDPGVIMRSVSGLLLWMEGSLDRSLERSEDAIALATQINHPYSMAYAYFHNSLLHLWRREHALVVERARSAIEIAEKFDYQVWRAVGTCLHGAALAHMGKLDEGLPQVVDGLQLYQGLNTPPIFWPILLLIQAEVFGIAGEPGQGLAALDEATGILGIDPKGILMPLFMRAKGNLILARSSNEMLEAEMAFQRSIQIAEEYHLRTMELQTALALSRLWRDQGKKVEAMQLVKAKYQVFTEGFQTPDLMDARAFLSE